MRGVKVALGVAVIGSLLLATTAAFGASPLPAGPSTSTRPRSVTVFAPRS